MRYFTLSLITFLFLFLPFVIKSQSSDDTAISIPWWNLHFQSTVIAQTHPPFYAKYSGINSLDKNGETATSVTSTLFFGSRLWEGATAYFNPELSGGSGFSSTTGIAGYPNGEIYRVNDPSPHIYIARLWLRQLITLSSQKHFKDDDLNQVPGFEPNSYISINLGKFSIMDFFDNNTFSHDPRTQFYNWALMGNGAWDYPANTRGYTYGLALELVKTSSWAIRYAIVMVATTANGSKMDFTILRSNSQAIEFEKDYKISRHPGVVRIMGYFTQAGMGNYKDAIKWGASHDTIPLLTNSRGDGHTKWGFGLNAEQAVHKFMGLFLRAGWNDGQNETWAFTEIDRHLSAGLSIKSDFWKREGDNFGIAVIINGLSKDHKNFLKAGGYGFIIGDGNLNYSPEFITEVYYNFRFFKKNLWLSPDYQFILNPAYNSDRGPVHAFGIRAHLEI
jgi:high affinity Mn2+ porin